MERPGRFSQSSYDSFSVQSRPSFWNTQTSDSLLSNLFRLMDVVDGSVPGKLTVHGKIYEPHSQRYTTLPINAEQPTDILQLASQVALDHFNLGSLDGIKFGHAIARTPPVPQCHYGILLAWHVRNRGDYRLMTIRPSDGVHLKRLLPGQWSHVSHIVF